MKDKKSLRELAKEIFKLDKIDVDLANSIIFEKVINHEKYINAKTLFIYVNLANEVDTLKIILDALSKNKEVFVPKVNKNRLDIYKINSLMDLEVQIFNILEPKKGCELSHLEKYDLSIIPCVMATIDGKRLGHGKGYYDKILKEIDTYKMCLCFKNLIVENIETNDLDVTMDEVITD